MAQSRTDELFDALRARGLRTRVARALSEAATAAGSGAASGQKVATERDQRPAQAGRRSRGSRHRQRHGEAQRGGEEGRCDAQDAGDQAQHRARRRRPPRASARRLVVERDAQVERRRASRRGTTRKAQRRRRKASTTRKATHVALVRLLAREAQHLSERYPQRAFSLPPDATEVVLVRHGASAAAVPGEPFPLVLGRGDPPLSPEGEQQAAAVADRLAGEPLAGALRHAAAPHRRRPRRRWPSARGSTPSPIEDLCEVHLGEWEGGEFRIRVAQGDQTALQLLREERWDLIPGAESARRARGARRGGHRRDRRRDRPGRDGRRGRARRRHRRGLPSGHRQPPVRVHPLRQRLDHAARRARRRSLAAAQLQRHRAPLTAL